MKKIGVILACICIAFAAASQESKPTKQQTVSWLREKLEKYMAPSGYYRDFKIKKIDENEIVVTYNGYATYEHTETFSTANVTIASYTDGSYRLNSVGEHIIEEQQHGGYYYKKQSVLTSNIKITNGEEDLYARLEKALKHLASFKEKKNEVF